MRVRAGSARFLRLPLGRQGDPAWRLGGGAAGALQAGVPKRLARRALAVAASLALAATALVGPLPAALAEGDQAPQPVASSIAQPRYLLAASVGGGRSVPVLSADVALAPVAPEAQAPEGDPAGAPASPEEAQGEGAASPALPALSAVTASFSVDGCTYAIEPDGATVALVAVDPSLEGELVVPEEIADETGKTYRVLRIAEGAFDGSRISKLVTTSSIAEAPVPDSTGVVVEAASQADDQGGEFEGDASLDSSPEQTGVEDVETGEDGSEDPTPLASLQGASAGRQALDETLPYRVVGPSPLSQTLKIGGSVEFTLKDYPSLCTDYPTTENPLYGMRDHGYYVAFKTRDEVQFLKNKPTIGGVTPTTDKSYVRVSIHHNLNNGYDYLGTSGGEKGGIVFPTGVTSVRVVEKAADGWKKVRITELKSAGTSATMNPYAANGSGVRIFLNDCGTSKVTWDYNGGKGPTASTSVAPYATATAPTPYSRTGYKFLGWFTSKTGGDKEADAGKTTSTPIFGNRTYYAHWEPLFTASYASSHGTPSKTSDTISASALTVTLPTISTVDTGWKFNGWTCSDWTGTKAGGSSVTFSSAANKTVTASFSAKQSSLTFDANGGTWPSGGAPSGVEATYGSAMPTTGVRSPNPPAGYAFAGYYDGTGANAKRYYNDSSADFVTSACAWDKDTEESTTLYARWTKTVKLDKQGGSGGTDSVTYTRGIGFSSGVTKPTTAPSGGWAFLGYCDYDPSNSPGSNVYQFFDATGARTGRTYDSVGNTIYAWWVKQVTLNRYAAAAVDGKVTKLWALKGAPLGYACSTTASTESAIRDKFPSAGIAGTTGWAPTFDTWTFAGYYNSGTGSTCYLTSSGGRSAKCPDNMPATIYAKWKRVVTLHYENGTTGDASKTTVDACFNNPMPSVSKPAFSGWTFAGYWSKTKGEGDRYYNDNGSSARTFSSSYGATNLYAKWVRTITLDPNGGNAQGSVSSIELVSGQELPSKLPSGWEAPTNRGMCFAGYYEPYRSDIERYSFRGELLTGVNDLGLQNTPAVFKAKWQPIYEITLDKRGGSGGLDRFYVGYNTGFFADAQCTKELIWPIMLPSPPDGFDRPYIRGFAYLDGVNASGHATGNGVINSDGSLSGTVTSTTFSKDTRLYATYTPKNITVTWSLRGAADSSAAKHGSWTSSLSDNADKTKTRPYDGNALGGLVPSAPMRAGYQFVGWSTEPSPDGKSTYEGVNFITPDNALPTSDTTYYARWREIIHVGWHTNDGDWDEGGYYYRSTDSLWGDPVSPISNKVNRTGYAFLGWSTDQSATQPDQQYVQKVTGPLTYYAVWKANDYALTLDANGGSWAQGVADPPTIQATYDSVLPTEGVPVPTWTGRKFLGYNDRADGTGKAYYGANEGGTAVADPKRWDKVTPGALYAQWQVIEYPITYTCSLCEEEADGTVRVCPHMDTSSLPASFTVLDLEEGSSVWVGKPEMSPGYGFDFWRAFDPGSEGSEEGAFIWEVGPKRFEAKAYLEQYTVHLDAAGGAFADGSQSTHLTYTIESDAIQLERPRWGGHTFAGWVDEDGEPFGGTIAAGSTGDRSYTATWSLEYYPIEYDLRGGRFPNVMVPYGYSYDSPDVPLVAPIRDGYHFTGWLDADNQDVEPVIDLVIPTHSWGEKRFIATWEAVRYLIRFDLGLTDAAWEPDDQGATPPNPMEAAYDQPIAMPRAPKRAGYIFKGWGQLGVVTTPGGSQETVVRRVFEPGKEYKVNLAQDEGATVTLTGLWERNLAASVPVEIDLRLFANYGTGQFEVGPESEGSDIGTFENRSSGELKVTGLGEVTDDGAFAQERRDARLEAFGTAANLAQVQLTLQPLDGEGEPTGTRAQLPLGGSTTLSEVPDDQGISYAPGWMMPPGGRLVVGYGLDTGSLQVHEMKRDLHKPMAKLSYTLALVNP